jgi:hypothetical protein
MFMVIFADAIYIERSAEDSNCAIIILFRHLNNYIIKMNYISEW